MRITIRQKNLVITPALRIYIESKLIRPVAKILRGLAANELPILDLEFERITFHHHKGRIYRAEANLSFGKKLIRAEVEEDDIRKACDLLKEELEQGLTHYLGRLKTVNRRGARRAKDKLKSVD